MIEIWECTDCTHCASFDLGYRVYCLHPDLPVGEVYKYEPLKDGKDARDCDGFEGGEPHDFSRDQLLGAEKVSPDNENFEKGIREWCLGALKKDG